MMPGKRRALRCSSWLMSLRSYQKMNRRRRHLRSSINRWVSDHLPSSPSDQLHHRRQKPQPPPAPKPVAFSPTPPRPQFVSQLEKAPVYQPVDVTIELPVPPEFLEPLKSLAAEEGTRVTFEGCVRGKPEPSIKWFKEGKQLTDSADFEITYQNGRVKLVIPEVFKEDSGKYVCSAQNKQDKLRVQQNWSLKVRFFISQFPDLCIHMCFEVW